MLRLLSVSVLLTCSVWAQTPADRIAAALNAWHNAAAAADEAVYFGYFAPNGVFMGTDASERWTVKEFRVWAKPHFDQKKTWDFKPRDRHIDFSADGKTAWFDELLNTGNLGLCRGSGVLVMIGKDWKIAQYNLSIPIPNDLAKGIVREIAGAGK